MLAESFWNSGNGTVLEQPVNQNVVDVTVATVNQEDNKALWVGYLVDEDKLYVMASVNFSRRRNKMRVGQDLLGEKV